MNETALVITKGDSVSSERVSVVKRQSGLMRGSVGFTLVELLMVITIISALAALSIPSFSYVTSRAKITRTIAEVRGIEKDIVASTVDTNTLPDALSDIGLDSMRDAWGNPYQYLNHANGGAPRQSMFLTLLNSDYDLYSLGPDGLSQPVVSDPNGLDDILRASDGGWVGLGEKF